MHLVAGCIVAASLVQQPAPAAREAADVAELSRLETAWSEVHVRGDADALERLWMDDWRFTKVYVRRAGQWRVVAYHASASAP